MCEGMAGNGTGWSERLPSGGPNPVMGLEERKGPSVHRFKDRVDEIEPWGIKWDGD